MPLLDHFRPPLERTHPWRSFHGVWAGVITGALNRGVLPDGYYAVAFLGHDGPVEIDVATPQRTAGPGADPTAGWVPEAPSVAVAIDPPPTDDVRIDILSDAGDPPLVAAIELVSPANKDRRTAREAFATKCASYLSRGAGLVVVDLVTIRRADLHAALLSALGAEGDGPPVPSAAAYRAAKCGDRIELSVWPHALAVGQPLPTLPLWLAPDLCVPLDLEASYMETCADLRITPAV